MRAGLFVLIALGVGTAAVGCVLVTGSTGGYTGPEAGATVPVGEACDCGAGVCCLPSLDAEIPLITCQASCPEPWKQLCTRASDCGDAATATCLIQACTIDDASIQLQSCGPIPICAQ
jgi:hypothetical protein